MTGHIIKEIEEAINEFAKFFIDNPWHHRVEHSLHCELYWLLKKKATMSGTIEGNSDLTTQMIHKEYPEPKAHSRRKKRGNFDLAVLNPESERWDVHAFRYGRLPILSAIEIGLNYQLNHLKNDTRKLKKSGLKHCYLIHFAAQYSRNQKGVFEYAKELIDRENRGDPIKIVLVDIDGNFHRKLGDSKIRRIHTEKESPLLNHR